MTIQEFGVLAGVGVAAGGVIANAAIAWWRVGAGEKARLALEERVECLEEFREEIIRATAESESQREQLFRRVNKLDGQGVPE